MHAFDTGSRPSIEATEGRLGDAQLDQIAGGGLWLFTSICTFGLACAMMSIGEAASGRDCGESLKD